MPIPVPTKDKKGNLDLGECIRFLRKEGYSDQEQRVAICMSTYRKAHGIPEPKGK